MRILGIILIIIFIFPLIGLADVEGCGFIGEWNHMMNFGYGGIFIWLIFAVILILVIYFINNSKSNESPGRSKQTALDIIKERYAKGEISEEEFEKMKKKLTN